MPYNLKIILLNVKAFFRSRLLGWDLLEVWIINTRQFHNYMSLLLSSAFQIALNLSNLDRRKQPKKELYQYISYLGNYRFRSILTACNGVIP